MLFFFFLSRIKQKLLDYTIFHYMKKKVAWDQRKDQKTRNKNFMEKVTVTH